MTTGPRRTAPFFLLAFAVTWGLQVPGVLAQRGLLPGEPAVYLPLAGLGLFGPLVAAVVLTRREGGAAALRGLGARLLRYRVSLKWYLAALVLPGALLSLALWLLSLAGRHGPIAYLPSAGGVVFAVVVSVVEEVGWRGYALPRLTERFGAVGASAIIGVAWYLWHLPMFAAQGVPPNLFLVMLLYFVGASLFMTWLYERSGGSLLLMVVAHVGAHLNNSHRALPAEALPLVVHAVVYAALGWLVLRKVGSDRGARPVRLEHLLRTGRLASPARAGALRRGLG
jgi:membrane protease YdiL (CAAX protease family)